MKVRMLEELVSRIDGKPVPGGQAEAAEALGLAPTPRGSGASSPRAASLERAAPVPSAKVTASGGSTSRYTEGCVHPRSRRRPSLPCPVPALTRATAWSFVAVLGTLCPASERRSAARDAGLISPRNPTNYQAWK